MDIHTQQGLITETVVYRTLGDTETGDGEEKKRDGDRRSRV